LRVKPEQVAVVKGGGAEFHVDLLCHLLAATSGNQTEITLYPATPHAI